MVDHTLDEVLDAVKAEDAGADSLIAYTASLKEQLDAALASENLSQATKDKINAIFDLSTASAAKLAAAVSAPAVP
jgi:hypothetical protein